jgi:uncharacterized membrane protein YjjP (DUF1212 family)
MHVALKDPITNISGPFSGNFTVGNHNTVTTFEKISPETIDLRTIIQEVHTLQQQIKTIFPTDTEAQHIQKTGDAIAQQPHLHNKLANLTKAIGTGAVIEAIGKPLGDAIVKIIGNVI